MTPTAEGVATSRGMIDSLTVLRGLAAWAVVLTHCLRLLESIGGVAIPVWLSWLDLGDFAVLVFFCLSGFTLTRAHGADAWDGPGWGRFLTRRVFRVYPAFLVSFVVCLAVVAQLSDAGILRPGSWVGDTNRAPDPAIALAQLSFTSNLLGLGGYVNNAYWSLPVEFQFYLLFPLFSVLLRRSPPMLAATAFALAAAARALHLPGLTADLAWVFVGGMLAARFARVVPPRLVWWSAWLALAAACVLSNLPHAALRALPGPLALYLGAMAIMLVTAASRANVSHWRDGRSWRGLMRQGEISYSIYLFHTPPLLIAYWLVREWDLASWSVFAVVYGTVLPLTLVSANLVFVTVERPGIRIGRRLSDRRRRRAVE